MTEESQTQFPSPQKFFLEIPLYAPYAFTEIRQVFSIEFYLGTVDTYCVECARESVFQSDAKIPLHMSAAGQNWSRDQDTEEIIESQQISNNERDRAFWPFAPNQREVLKTAVYFKSSRYLLLTFHCTRDSRHLLHYSFLVHHSSLVKIGQHPSLADLDSAHIEKYRKVLSKAKYPELSRAIELSAQGVGVGSFVYLRRIFEDLIEEARKIVSADASWDESKYQKGRTEERILLLKDYLPSFLVEHRKLYKILSKGIHELTEDECNKHFAAVKIAIELILDAKLKELEREEKEKKASGDLTDLLNELSAKKE